MTGFNSKRKMAADKMQEPVTEREALKLALEALEAMQMCAAAERKGLRICDEAIITIKEASAQPPLPERQQTVEALEKELEDMIRERDKRNAVLSDIANLIGVEFSSAYRFADLVEDLNQRLAASPPPAQEPVAHVYLFDHEGRPLIAWDNAKGIKIGDKLYTAPPQGYA